MVNLKSISNESTQSYVGAVCNPPPLHSTRFQVRNSFTKHMHRRKKARTGRAFHERVTPSLGHTHRRVVFEGVALHQPLHEAASLGLGDGT